MKTFVDSVIKYLDEKFSADTTLSKSRSVTMPMRKTSCLLR